MIDNPGISGSRWLSQLASMPEFEEKPPNDGCGVGSQMSLFYFDSNGACQIKVSETMYSFAMPMIQLKFEQMLHNHNELWLCWKKNPSEGLHVSDIIGDAERAWSLLKFYFLKLVDRQKVDRHALRTHDSERGKLVFSEIDAVLSEGSDSSIG